MKISDNPVLLHKMLHSDFPIGVIDMSISMLVWVIVSFFLVLFIMWQTNLSGVKLNRSFFLCYGIHMVITCLSRGIVECIVGGNGISTSVTILTFLMVLVGVSFGITYLVQKKNGMLNSYQAYSDIMTEEEFERWQKKKQRKK